MLFVGQKKAIGHNAHYYIMTLKKQGMIFSSSQSWYGGGGAGKKVDKKWIDL